MLDKSALFEKQYFAEFVIFPENTHSTRF